MAFVLKKKNVEHCIIYEEGEAKIKFFCQEIPKGKNKRITNRNLEINEGKTGINFDGLEVDKIDAVIKEWEGIEDEDGNSVPCNKRNKIALYEERPDIVDFAFTELHKRIDEREKNKEAELGN